MKLLCAYRRTLKLLGICGALVALSGCAHEPPTIAHTHIGHAVTAFDGTPEEKGLFVITEERSGEAMTYARAAANADNDLKEIKQQVQAVVDIYESNEFGIRLAMDEAAKHIEFAATSEDASPNVQRVADEIRAAADGVLNRSDLIVLLGNDALNTQSLDEARVLAKEVAHLAEVNVSGGGPGELGVTQIRTMIDDMIAAEDPAYVTVDRWYLFHLVRLPDCDTCWAWRKWANSSNRGY